MALANFAMFLANFRAGQNGIDIEVARHHTVSVSNFQSIEVSTDDRKVRL